MITFKKIRIVAFIPVLLVFLALVLPLKGKFSYPPESNIVQETFDFVIYGDSRSNPVVHDSIIQQIILTKPEAVFHTGDLVYNGKNKKQWEEFNKITEPMLKMAPFYPVLGNHERDSPLFLQNFDLPEAGNWYSVDMKSVHFIILDSNKPIEEGSEQIKWLKNDLEKMPKETDFIFVVLHHPLYSTGPHKEDAKGLRESLVPLLEKYKAEAVFAGHDHSFERSLVNGMYFVVTGGGGAPLYEQKRSSEYSQKYIKKYHFCQCSKKGDEVQITIIGTQGEKLDSFVIKDRK